MDFFGGTVGGILQPNNNHLILLDFDGTIMKTDEFNWECYNIVLNKYQLEISFVDFLDCISNSHLDTYFSNLGLKSTKYKSDENLNNMNSKFRND